MRCKQIAACGQSALQVFILYPIPLGYLVPPLKKSQSKGTAQLLCYSQAKPYNFLKKQHGLFKGFLKTNVCGAYWILLYYTTKYNQVFTGITAIHNIYIEWINEPMRSNISTNWKRYLNFCGWIKCNYVRG